MNFRFWTPAVAVVCLLFALFHSLNPLSSGAERYAAQVSATSAVTYVSLRTLNAFLSTAQEVEMGVTFGASGTIQPLKGLEPIDDTVERIAGVVFFLMVVSGVLAVGMGPVSGVGFAMAVCGFAWIWFRPGARTGSKLILYGAFFAIVLPLSYTVSGVLADGMTNAIWVENEQVIEEITSGIEVIDSESDDDRWFSGLRDLSEATMRYSAMATNIMSNADLLIASYIKLLAVLLFNLVLLPTVLIGGGFIVFRWAANDTL